MFDMIAIRQTRTMLLYFLAGVCLSYLPILSAWADEPPPGFSRLADVGPEIRQEMRYAGSDNFTGHPVPGYRAPDCWFRP